MNIDFRGASWSIWAFAALGLCLPFEFAALQIPIGPIKITNLELILLITLGFAFLDECADARKHGRSAFRISKPWLGCLASIALASLICGVLAPELRSYAVKGGLRVTIGVVLAMAIALRVRREREMLLISTGMLAGVLLSAALGRAEFAFGVPFHWMELIRTASVGTLGPSMRLTGSFDQPNQLSMALEASVPLLVALGLYAWEKNRRALSILCGCGILFFIHVAVLTYSRSSIPSLVLSSLAVLLLLRPANHFRKKTAWSAVIFASLLILGLHLSVDPLLRIRMQGEWNWDLYTADIQAPERFVLEAGTSYPIPLQIRNDSPFPWRSKEQFPRHLSLQTIAPETNQQVGAVLLWVLPGDLDPGESIPVVANLKAPSLPGTYTWDWRIEQLGAGWLHYRMTGQSEIEVQVADEIPPSNQDSNVHENLESVHLGPPVSQRHSRPQLASDPESLDHDRAKLWGWALETFLENPWHGIGFDVFRLVYGKGEIEEESRNDTLTTHNLFLEILVALGVLGALPCLLAIGLLARDFTIVLRSPSATTAQVAIAASLLAFFAHGMIDFFLITYPTGLFFWMLIGLWMSQRFAKPDKGQVAG